MTAQEIKSPPTDGMFLSKIARDAAAAALANHGGGPQDPPMDDTWRTKVDERLGGLDKGLADVKVSVAELKGDVSGLKIAVSVLASAMALGFAVIGAVTYSTQAKVDALGPRITEEFRLMRTEAAADARAARAEQSAQTSAIANAITATKQQAPQVILVPAPQVQPPPQQ